MIFYSLFSDVENENADRINALFPSKLGDLLMLFQVFDNYLNKVNGKIRTDQYPEHTILNLSA